MSIREQLRAASERARSLPPRARPTVTRPMTRPAPDLATANRRPVEGL